MANYYSKQELIQALQEQAEKIGCAPQPKDMTEPSGKAILGYFKNWSKALKSAGIQKVIASLPKNTDSDVKEAGKGDAGTGKVEKTVTESVKDETPKAAKAEKVQEEAPCHRRYSKSIITKMLLEECNRLGKKPTRKEIDENKDLPTVGTILKYFETTRIGDVWNEVLQ